MLTSKKNKGIIVILEIYIDDILLTSNDDTGIHATNAYLQQHMSICDLGSPNNFLGLSLCIKTGS